MFTIGYMKYNKQQVCENMPKIIRTNVIGILNTLPEKQYVLFWEFDKIELDQIIEEMNFISECFDIDIDILESSKNNYHAISYDILSYDELLSIHRYLYYSHGHYLDIDEIDLYRNFPSEITKGNTLRLGKKLGKDEPVFIYRINYYNWEITRKKSLQHFRAYQYFCKVPEFNNTISIMWYNLKTQFVVFACGISSKSNRKNQTQLQHRINQKVYKLLRKYYTHTKGEKKMSTMRYVVELSVTIFLAAFLLPPAISAIMSANVTNGSAPWNPAVVTIFQVLLPILVIVAVALALMPPEIKGKIGF